MQSRLSSRLERQPAKSRFYIARRQVARPDRHRKSQPERAVLVVDRLLIRDRDRHVLARTDVGDRNCEEIRTLLREQRSLLAFALGFFVGLLGVLLLLDLAFDDA